MNALDEVESGLEPTLAWLIRLRWVAVVGQAAMVAMAHGWFGLAMPLKVVIALVGLAAASNGWLTVRARRGVALRRSLLARVLLLDTLLLTALLACTGGVHSPFASFYLVHVAVAAVALGSLATLGYGSLFLFQDPHAHHAISQSLHLRGMFCATALTAACIAYFAGRLSRELRTRERALGDMRLLREQNERFAALATLAAGVAHELGSPLGTISVAARELEVLAQQRGDATFSADAVLIRDETERCRALLGRLNSRSTAELGEPPVECDAASILQSVRAILTPAHQGRTQFPAAVPGSLLVPKTAIAEALASLVRNACDAAEGPVQLEVTVAGSRIVFSVKDAGGPLSPVVVAHVGEPFFTTKEPGRGMGLGLYLVRLLAERLGGEFSLANEGAGTVATLSLPQRVELPQT